MIVTQTKSGKIFVVRCGENTYQNADCNNQERIQQFFPRMIHHERNLLFPIGNDAGKFFFFLPVDKLMQSNRQTIQISFTSPFRCNFVNSSCIRHIQSAECAELSAGIDFQCIN